MKLRYIYIPFLLMFLLASAIKFYQDLFIQPNLPASLKTYNLYSYAIISVFLLFFVIMAIMLLTVKNYPEKYIMKRNIPAGLSALFAGISIISYSALEYIDNFSELTNVNLVFNCVNCAIGFTLIIIAIACFAKKNILKEIPLIALAPAALACFKLAYTTFFSYPNLSEISDQTFKMLSFLFWALFAFAYAKLLCNFQTKSTIKKAIIWGLMCFSIIIIYTVPELVFNFNQLDVLELSRIASYLFIGLFAVCIAAELIMESKMDQVHSYNEDDFTTFEPSNLGENFKNTEEQNNKGKTAQSQFFDNLIKEDKPQKKNKKDYNVQEFDADFLVDDILNNND